jgi:hypothetical protein
MVTQYCSLATIIFIETSGTCSANAKKLILENVCSSLLKLVCCNYSLCCDRLPTCGSCCTAILKHKGLRASNPVPLPRTS